MSGRSGNIPATLMPFVDGQLGGDDTGQGEIPVLGPYGLMRVMVYHKD